MKWGFLSYGAIAPKFYKSLCALPEEELVAIATRSGSDMAAKDHPTVKIYADYSDFYRDPEVEIVYLSSTHNFHFEMGMEVLKAGKHLLCEKPMTTNAVETKILLAEAKKRNLFVMEAIWTRCMPAYRQIIEHVRRGDIGEVKFIQANFSFYNDWSEDRRLFNKDLAGGAIYDVGIYNLSLILDVMDDYPADIKALADLTPTMVDQSCAVILAFEGGRLASFHSGFRLDTDHCAKIFGTEGWISVELHWQPQKFTIHRNAEGTEEVLLPFLANGYAHEIIEAVTCIKKGKVESSLIPHQASIDLARAMDDILERIGYN